MPKTSKEMLELYVVLSRAYQWVNAHADRDIRRHGLTRTEFGVLELLYHKGPHPIQQIGSKVLMSSGNLTYVLNRLEEKRWVVRQPSTDDRRMVYASITESGSAFIEAVFPDHEAVIAAALAGLNAEERKAARRLLKKIGLFAQKTY